MPEKLSPLALFSSAIHYAYGTATLPQLARIHGVRVADLHRELIGIVPRQPGTWDTWLDAVPGRREALLAEETRCAAESGTLLADLELDQDRTSRELRALLDSLDTSIPAELLDG